MINVYPTADNVSLSFHDGETLEGSIDLGVGRAACIGRELIQAAEKARILKIEDLEDKITEDNRSLEFFKQIETGASK